MGWSTLGCNQQDLWGASERFVNCKPARMVPKVAGGASSKYGTSNQTFLFLFRLPLTANPCGAAFKLRRISLPPTHTSKLLKGECAEMNKPTLKEQAHGEIEKIFRILLPQNGLAVREEQITLCHTMLDKEGHFAFRKKNASVVRKRVSDFQKNFLKHTGNRMVTGCQ